MSGHINPELSSSMFLATGPNKKHTYLPVKNFHQNEKCKVLAYIPESPLHERLSYHQKEKGQFQAVEPKNSHMVHSKTTNKKNMSLHDYKTSFSNNTDCYVYGNPCNKSSKRQSLHIFNRQPLLRKLFF